MKRLLTKDCKVGLGQFLDWVRRFPKLRKPGTSADSAESKVQASRQTDDLEKLTAENTLEEIKKRPGDWRGVDSAQNQELALLRTELAEAQAQLGAIRGSASWRLTEPMRELTNHYPAIPVQIRRFLGSHPHVRGALLRTARLAWWMATLRLPARAKKRELKPAIPEEPSSARLGFDLQPIITSGGPARFSGESPRLICLSPVMPYPPTAGNEYRIHQMLNWLVDQSWEVLLVVCPLPKERLTPNQIAEAAEVYQNLIVCQRDGKLFHRLADGGAMLEGLSGRRLRSFSSRLPGDIGRVDESRRRLVSMMEQFCPDVLAELVLHLEDKFEPQVLLAEYVFMTRPFPMLRSELFKIVDTVEVFSASHEKVVRYGIEESLALDPTTEAELLNRADLLIAVQAGEAEALRKVAPERPVISVGVDFSLLKEVPSFVARPVILLVAAAIASNIKGLTDFYRFAWPMIRRELPDAELRIIGSVGEAAEPTPVGIQVLGQVEDIANAYAEARVIINPTVTGTGLKIQTVEALCHFRPIVLWPCGVVGLDPQVAQLCHIASNWFDFARHVIRLAGEEDGTQVIIRHRAMLEQQFAADFVYGPLRSALDGRTPFPQSRRGRIRQSVRGENPAT